MIQNFEQSENIICGEKMIEELIQNKFNAWRAKYYSQNWGDKSFENPPFYMVVTPFNINLYGTLSKVMMKV